MHGHIHAQSDYRVGETRVICNPAGYEGLNHNPRLLVELQWPMTTVLRT